MKQCKCGSYAFNLYKEDIDQGDLCDVHYWKEKALAQPEQEPVNIGRELKMDFAAENDKRLAQPEQGPDAFDDAIEAKLKEKNT